MVNKFTNAPKNEDIISKINEIIDDIPDTTNLVTTNTAQDISGRKTFLGEKAIYFKQNETTNKLGFTLFNPSDTELGALEYRPNTVGGSALFNLNTQYSNSCYVGFRYWGTNINIVAPKPTTLGSYYIPVNITDGTNTVTANNKGTVDISSIIPTATSDLTNDSGFVTSSVQTLQPISTTSGTLSLVDGTSMYKLTPSGATTISFTNNTTASSTKAYTFELCIDMSSSVYTITFPTITWQNGETPDMSSSGIYFFAFRTIDGGLTWLGNLQGVW